MTDERVERRLAAVLAADVAGYSRLMGIDEEGTLARLKAARKTLVDPAIASHRGRIVKTTGDGMLVEFGSAVDAVRGAVEVQRSMAEQNAAVPQDQRIEFRIGINVGDVIIDGDDIFGDGVNVAARVEAECEPGGVYLSANAFEQIRSKTSFIFDDMGERNLKNIDRPVRVYSARTGEPRVAAQSNEAATVSMGKPLALPDKPSIAVLPFQNMSGDPEQEYFADGMVEEITTALSRFKFLFVIARNSSFAYKGRAVDIKQVGRELGVRYVLEGSVRRASSKVRMTGQLNDAMTGAHLWADRFEGDLRDIFALQDRMTESVISAIAPKLAQTEIERAARRRPDNLNAYDLGLRALSHLYSMTREGLAEALELLKRALEIDPRYGTAAALAASCHTLKIVQGWAADPKWEMAEATRLSFLALSIDANDAETLALVGRGRAYLSGDFDAAMEMVDRAVALNPNSANIWDQRSWTYQYAGRAEEAIQSFERAIRLSPLDPMLFSRYAGMGTALLRLNRFEEAVAAANRALRLDQTWSTTYRCLAAALAHLGRGEEARKAAARLLEIEPGFRISEWVGRAGKWQSTQFLEGLRKAGLPE